MISCPACGQFGPIQRRFSGGVVLPGELTDVLDQACFGQAQFISTAGALTVFPDVRSAAKPDLPRDGIAPAELF
jgi:hypothetical protein